MRRALGTFGPGLLLPRGLPRKSRWYHTNCACSNASKKNVEPQKISPPKGTNLRRIMRDLRGVVFRPNHVYPGYVTMVIKFAQLLEE
jgi:hypothetical protein